MNNFRFSLSQGDIILFEQIFNAEQFSQHTRNYVDIRKILPLSINQLQKVLSKNNYNTKIVVDSNKMTKSTLIKGKYYDLYSEYIRSIKSFPIKFQEELYYNPEPLSFKVDVNTSRGIESMAIKGVECKISLYRNDTSIVERLFYVDRFNPVARWSTDLTTTCEYIANDIFNIIKKSDISYLWTEYDKLEESTNNLVIN